MEGKATRNPENAMGAWLIIVLAIYAVRVMPWAISEYWYDEVLTLGDFALDSRGRGLWEGVFRNYPIANNHILSTALYWIWIRVLDFSLGAEQLVRLPSILFGAGTIALMVCHWRKWLGGRLANLAGILFAISPVFTAYAYQVRGYSMSIFGTTLALSGLLEWVHGNPRRGIPLTCATAFLLPLVIPSNILVVPVLALPLFASGRSWGTKVAKALPLLVCGGLGCSYYFTIWPQFVRAAAEPAGWDSAWLVAGNLLLALAIHSLIPLLMLIPIRANSPAATSTPDSSSPEPPPAFCESSESPHKNQAEAEAQAPFAAAPKEETVPHPPLCHWPSLLGLGSVLVIGGTLAVAKAGQAPYPRVFLIFLPIFSLALLLLVKRSRTWASHLSFPVLLVLVLVNGVVWEALFNALTQRELSRGVSPSNLLQQYYRGSSDLREAVFRFNREKWMDRSIVMTDEYDQPTTAFYWQLAGGKGPAVHTFNTIPEGFFREWRGPRPRLWAIAKTPDAAARMFRFAGAIAQEDPSILSVVAKIGRRTIYALNIPTPPAIPQADPPLPRPLDNKTI